MSIFYHLIIITFRNKKIWYNKTGDNMNSKYKHINTIKIILICFVIILVSKDIIALYNEKTPINTKTNEVNEIFEKYDNTHSLLLKQLDKICEKENNIYILKNKYENNSNYTYYNGVILIISNFLNSSDKFFLTEKKFNKIDYDTINFKNRITNYKQIMSSMLSNDNNNIINAYINSIINIISISYEEDYYNMKTNKLFNLSGKKYIYNDYNKIISIELEYMTTLYNIVQYIENTLEM